MAVGGAAHRLFTNPVAQFERAVPDRRRVVDDDAGAVQHAAGVVVDRAEQADAIDVGGDAPSGEISVGFVLSDRREQLDA